MPPKGYAPVLGIQRNSPLAQTVSGAHVFCSSHQREILTAQRELATWAVHDIHTMSVTTQVPAAEMLINQ